MYFIWNKGTLLKKILIGGYVYWFESEKYACERETSIACGPHAPLLRIEPATRYMPWPGIKPATFWCTGWFITFWIPSLFESLKAYEHSFQKNVHIYIVLYIILRSLWNFWNLGVSGISNPELRFYSWILSSFSPFADTALEFRKIKTFWRPPWHSLVCNCLARKEHEAPDFFWRTNGIDKIWWYNVTALL